MKCLISQGVGANITVEVRTGSTNGPVHGYIFCGVSSSSNSAEVTADVPEGAFLRMLWGSNPTWTYMGPWVQVTSPGGVSFYRQTAIGPTGGMTVNASAWVETSPTIALPSYFTATSAELGEAFRRGFLAYITVWCVMYIIKKALGLFRRPGAIDLH